MQKRILFLLGLVILLIPVPYIQAGYTTIPADTLEQWITQGTNFDFLLIDVRETSEAATVIGTETCKPYLLPWNSGVFTQTIGKLPKDIAIVLYCRTGHRSGLAAQQLSDSGFTKAYSLENGFTGWGNRSTTTGSTIKPTDELPEPSRLQKPSTAIAARIIGTPPVHRVQLSAHRITVTAPIASQHTLDIFDIRGTCVARAENPFRFQTVWMLPGLCHSDWIVRLESPEGRIVTTVKIVN